MVGRQRLADVRWCVDQVMAEGVPGDFIETGVWRGGVTILMKGMLEASGDTRPAGLGRRQFQRLARAQSRGISG